ncbi:hypothetical protein IPZ61_06540 [Streptomyces sioyaensis]|uniref:hypothetical protein n=1 Tax=Streptomyces sioyaensis TaxID=67364 RepID=UPI001F3DB7E3|nr:hypothetical protein [Streptomyces sioyaensis]MCF3172971.1 hypothetical protein [Streptomyces sioyaensis]
MGVYNVQERMLSVAGAEAGLLVDGLSGEGDRFWSRHDRPAIGFDAALADSLDRAEEACTGAVARPARWSRYVRLPRRLVR